MLTAPLRSICSVLFRYLPTSLRARLKAAYYLRVVRGFNEAGWSCAAGVRQLLESGWCVVDAGANVGYVSKLLAEWVGPKGCVLSIEPVGETFAVLEANMKRLGLTQVEAVNYALSAESGEGWMEVPRRGDGVQNFYESHLVDEPSSPGGDSVSVNRITLDELVDRLHHPVDFVKIDVEGHELEVLRGARRLLASGRPALLIEVAGDPDAPGEGAHALFEMLAGLGYQPCLYEPGGFRGREPGERQGDYYFLTEAQLSGANRIGPSGT